MWIKIKVFTLKFHGLFTMENQHSITMAMFRSGRPRQAAADAGIERSRIRNGGGRGRFRSRR
jgi:hypothetical protein